VGLGTPWQCQEKLRPREQPIGQCDLIPGCVSALQTDLDIRVCSRHSLERSSRNLATDYEATHHTLIALIHTWMPSMERNARVEGFGIMEGFGRIEKQRYQSSDDIEFHLVHQVFASRAGSSHTVWSVVSRALLPVAVGDYRPRAISREPVLGHLVISACFLKTSGF